MTTPNTPAKWKAMMQKAGTTLSPPITAILCLLAGLDLGSIALVTIAATIPASLYQRRLSASEDHRSSSTLQEDKVEVFENKKHIVVYKTPEGPQFLAFYKIMRRPTSYSLDILKTTFANGNLTIHPMIHANGAFLAIRFSNKRKNYQKSTFWEEPEHLESLARNLTRQVPGLALEAAALSDIKALLGIFGLKIAEEQISQLETRRASNRPESSLSEADTILSETFMNSIRNIEMAPVDAVLSEEAIPASSVPEMSLNGPRRSFSNDKPDMAKNAEREIQALTESYQKIRATAENMQNDPSVALMTSTGKRIAGQLVVKDLREALEALQNGIELPSDVEVWISDYQAYLNRHFENLSSNYTEVDPDLLWEHIPEAIELLGRILAGLVATQVDGHPNIYGVSLPS
ncbi:MAG: hypothetical protein ACFFGZ_14600 [Candidatus Thorarchaeota archaeon]